MPMEHRYLCVLALTSHHAKKNMSSNANAAEIEAINTSSTIFIRTWCFTMFALGIIGHTLNIYIFTRPVLRSSPCARYFLASSISGCLVVFMTLPIRLLQAGYMMNVVTHSEIACKMLTFVLFWARAQPSWFMVLASVDRFLCSSTSGRLRAWSRVSLTWRAIPLTSLLVLLAYLHVPIFHAINVPQRLCFPIAGAYQTFFGIWNLLVFSVGPPGLMLLFGLLTVRHIRQSVGRVADQNTSQVAPKQVESQQRRKKADRQIIQMMLVQCLMFTLTASPTSMQYIYTAIRATMVVDGVQRAKDNYFYTIAGFVSLSVPCTSFYLFTLSSKLFRHELACVFVRQRRSVKPISVHSQNRMATRN